MDLHNDQHAGASMTNGTMSEDTKNGILNNIPRPPVIPLDKQRLQELVHEVDPNEHLEEEVEDVLLSLADDFIDSLVTSSCMIAKHRKSNTLEVKDVQLALEKNWNMWIPGFGVDGVVGVYSGTTGTGQGTGAAATAAANSKPKKCFTTEAHKQRLALIKKTIKKF
ncbi:PREDICTED: transcription initiation factor TFIID subunit 12-like [Rhagoletis zephyria]|uniref:transcription initiation factor TFIID subunit 12-like n=1 Tax=Rhagoletis zephyria TaxID=28612 RepID=UPI00081160B6|nr:PREDICTED: transcription initiation factor TFIID subunit 12-like [Rhagoletis zephyria]KAH9396607.1 Transcription initiation factor TFIID subunit 12 [Tyrophagus putrescentiae]